MHPRRMQFVVISILLIGILAACAQPPASSPSASTGSTAASGGCTNAYYPVPSGASWSYASNGGNLGAYTYAVTVTAASDTGFTTSEQYSSGVNYIFKWNCQDGNLAALDAGSNSFSMTTSKVKMTSSPSPQTATISRLVLIPETPGLKE